MLCLCNTLRCSFSRPPKCIDKELTNAMKLHVTGVIIHGNPDNVNVFAALPHLKGDSNLNCECIFRALKKHFSSKGMLPKLHVQVHTCDSAHVDILR